MQRLHQTIGPNGLQIPLPLIQQYGLVQGEKVIVEFEAGRVRLKPMQLPAALIEQQALRVTLKHLGDGVTVKAVPHRVGWQVDLYGVGMEHALGYLMYDANGKLLSDINEVVEQIFATSGT